MLCVCPRDRLLAPCACYSSLSERVAVQAEFWKEMCHHQPSLMRLDSIGCEYDACIKKSEACFAQMFRLSPQSVTIMRKYAQFLLEVCEERVCVHVCVCVGGV